MSGTTAVIGAQPAVAELAAWNGILTGRPLVPLELTETRQRAGFSFRVRFLVEEIRVETYQGVEFYVVVKGRRYLADGTLSTSATGTDIWALGDAIPQVLVPYLDALMARVSDTLLETAL